MERGVLPQRCGRQALREGSLCESPIPRGAFCGSFELTEDGDSGAAGGAHADARQGSHLDAEAVREAYGSGDVSYLHSNSFHRVSRGFLLEDGAYIADLRFTCIRRILSLPIYHGARWSAWLRFACSKAGCMWEDAFAALLPFRSGDSPILPGQELVVRVILTAKGLKPFARVLNAIAYTRPEGEFSPLTLRLSGVDDAVAGKPAAIDPDGAAALEPFTADLARREAEMLMRGGGATLAIRTPLRLNLPGGMKNPMMQGIERYCRPGFFEGEGRALGLSHIAGRVRGFRFKQPSPGPLCTASAATWDEMRYSRQRQVPLGGITGIMRFKGEIREDDAIRLACGQYLGSGRNGRFGMGFYTILELEGAHALALPYCT